MADLRQVVNFSQGESSVNLTSNKFSLFLFLILLYIFQLYGVFINKVLQCCIILCKGFSPTADLQQQIGCKT
jgi:hypothetical protein